MPDPNPSLTLSELLNIANKGYPDNELAIFFDPITGGKNRTAIDEEVGDGLAKFIVIELIETFDEKASREDQLDQAVHTMENASDEILGVINVLLEAR